MTSSVVRRGGRRLALSHALALAAAVPLAAALGAGLGMQTAIAAEWTVAPADPPMLTYGVPGDGDEVRFSAMCPVGTGPYEVMLVSPLRTVQGITVAADGTRNSLQAAKVVLTVGKQNFAYDSAAVGPDDLSAGLEIDLQITNDDPFMAALAKGAAIEMTIEGKAAGKIPLHGIAKPLATFIKACGGK